jgi:hypothetical protein
MSDPRKYLFLPVAISALSFSLLGSPASAAPCLSLPVAAYTASGSSCSVDGLTFSNLSVNVTTAGGGSVVLGNISPFIFGNEFGLSMNYTALAPVAGASTDIAWAYNVTANPGLGITDALSVLAGNTSGAGVAAVGEILSNAVTLSLNAPGQTSAFFAAITALNVFKDQIDFVGPAGGFSTTSILTNAFSTSVVPLPGSLALFATGLCGLGLLGRRMRKAPQPRDQKT